MGKNEIIFAIMLLIIGVILVASYFVIPFIASDDLPQSLGLFGDQFGAVNSLFSGLAFAGLIYTILLQKEELKAQREELKYTRDEIAGQKLELKQQNETLTLQRFETSFFNMLSQHNEIVSNFKYGPHGGNPYTGKTVLGIISGDFANHWNRNVLPQNTDMEKIEKVRAILQGDYNNNFSEYLGVFFRSLKCLLTIITEQPNAQFYADIIKSQLSEGELKLIFLYGLLPDSDFQKFIRIYNLLEHYPSTQYRSIGLDMSLYENT